MHTVHVAPQVTLRQTTVDKLTRLLDQIESINFRPECRADQNTMTASLIARIQVAAVEAKVLVDLDRTYR